MFCFCLQLVINYFKLLDQRKVNVASFLIGLLVFIFLILIRVCNLFLKKKLQRFPLQIPGPLLAVRAVIHKNTVHTLHVHTQSHPSLFT